MEQKDIQQTIKDHLTRYLVQNGMRCTPERYAILRTIYEQKGPFTVDDLYELLDDSYHVSRVTIYSALDLFVRIGLVLRYPSTSIERYEKCYGVRDHFKQICTYCGRVTDFRSQIVVNSLLMTPYTRFRPEFFSVSVYGICSKCQAKLTRQQKKYEKEQEKKNTKSRRKTD